MVAEVWSSGLKPRSACSRWAGPRLLEGGRGRLCDP